MGITNSGNVVLSALRYAGPKGRAQANAHILESLEICGWDVKRTAAFLKIGRITLIRWIGEAPHVQEALRTAQEALRTASKKK